MTSPRRLVASLVPVLAAVFVLSALSFQEARAAEEAGKPTVRLISPTSRDAAAGEVRIEAIVDGALPGDSLDLFVNGRKFTTLTAPPWRTFWQAPEAVRRHHVTAVLVRDGREIAKSYVQTRDLGFTSTAGAHAVGLAPIVTDKNGRYVSGLTRKDFSVVDEGQEQRIDTFEAMESPLAVLLVMDASESMVGKIDDARAAAHAFIKAFNAGDELGLYTFNSSLTGTIDLTKDLRKLHAALDEIRPEGATALYDATGAAIRRLKKANKRKAIVLFTDGADNQSRLSVDQVIDIARASEVSIFSVALGVDDESILGAFLRELTEQTGGRSIFIGHVKKLSDAFRSIVDELKSQYYLTYVPRAHLKPRTWRKVQVRVRKPELLVRAKREYFVE